MVTIPRVREIWESDADVLGIFSRKRSARVTYPPKIPIIDCANGDIDITNAPKFGAPGAVGPPVENISTLLTTAMSTDGTM